MHRTPWIVAVGLLVLASPAFGGGGPETTLVVANANDQGSLRIANAYARGRGIPLRHVLWLEDVPDTPTIDVATFRERILLPVQQYLEAEGIDDQIDLVAYSSGFPYAVSFDVDAKEKGFAIQMPISRMASLTGLTYLYRSVLAKEPAAYLSLTANRYYRRDDAKDARPARQPDAEDIARIRTYRSAIQSKDYRRAAEALEALVGDFPEVAAFWYDLACCRALLGKGDEAMAALEKAVEHGFENAAHAAEDADLQSLRDRPRFRELLDAMREARRNVTVLPSRAFSAANAWDESGNPTADGVGPHRYRLAVMLGWTGAHGNTVDEVLGYLKRARESDGTFPDGTVYLMKNPNVRSTTRSPGFESLAAAMERLGHRAVILDKSQPGQDGVLPRGKADAIGIMAGSATLRWRDTDPPMLPGGIGEHLTSFGAHFGTASQTKCTEFFRHGAAGTCGAVAEPYAIPNKFPSPWMHLHYARGCSLAEAFYQSVWGPYQLLVLGDPLTQPFAKGIDVHIDRPSGKEPLSKQVAIDPSFDVPSGEALGTKELWVDGRRVQAGPATELLAWDTTSVADGAHEIRVVAVEDGTIATRSSDARWVEVDNGSGFAVSIRPPDPVEIGGPLRLEGRAEGAHDVDLMRGAEVLATAPVARDRWKVAIETLRLGLGETTLQARGRAGGDREVWSRPVVVEIRPPDELEAARSLTAHDAVPGLHVVWTDEHGATHEGFAGTLAPRGRERSFAEDLDALGARDARRVVVEGSVRVPAGLAEVRVDGPESLEMSVDGRTVSFAADSSRTALLPLAEGWHDLRIRAEGPGVDRLAVEVGGSRARAPLAGADLAWLPGNLAPAERPASVTVGEEGRATAVLGDGGRAGAHGVDVGPDRAVVLAWDDKQRHVSTVVLYASSGDKASPITTRWTVETRTSDRGRWRDVHDLEALVAPPAARPKKNETLGPRFVLLRFHATTAKEVRVRPAKGEGTSRVAEVEIYAGTR